MGTAVVYFKSILLKIEKSTYFIELEVQRAWLMDICYQIWFCNRIIMNMYDVFIFCFTNFISVDSFDKISLKFELHVL